MEERDTLTVECVNSDRCGGRATVHLAYESRPPGLLVGGTVRGQTCDCEYSAEDLENLRDRAVSAQRRERP